MIENYIDLRLSVSDYVGNRGISDVFSTLVTKAEKRLNRRLRHRLMTKTATVTFSAGIAALPDDFIEMRLFNIGTRTLNQQTLEYYQDLASSLQYNSRSFYAVDASNIYVPSLEGEQTIRYYAKLPTITATPTSTNWLLDEYPDVYQYAVGVEAAKHLRDNEMEAKAMSDKEQAILELESDSERSEYGDAVVRVKGLTP